MIETSENNVKIYSSTNTMELKIKLIISILAAISGIYLYFTAHKNNWIFLMSTALMILFIYITLKNIEKKKKQVLEAEISAQGIKFYIKNQTLEFKHTNIKTVYADIDLYPQNKIIIIYYDDNKKEKVKIFNITGCNNLKFVDIVNNIKQID